jgi:HlyD family secretion protein
VLADTLKTMEIRAQVAEADVSRVSVGNRVTFTVNAYPNDTFVGKVTEKRPTPTSIQGAVYYTAIVAVENVWDAGAGSWKLLPGMPSSVDVIRREHADVWRAPTAALGFQPDEHHLTAEARGKLARRPGPDWRTVWVLDERKQPTPLWIRVGGVNAHGEEGFQDQQFTEVLEWEPEQKFDAHAPETWPQLIIGPPPGKPGLLDKGIKVF